MKKLSFFTQMITVALLPCLFIIACKKEHSGTLSPGEEERAATHSSESETENEVVFNDVFDNVLGVNTEVGIGGTGIFGRVATGRREMKTDSLPSCTLVSITQLNAPARFPMKIIIDFGAGCIGRDGHKRAGKIITEYSGRLIEPGSSAITHFENFKFDSISVSGTHKISNTTASGSNQRQFTIDITDARLTRSNGDYSLWSSQRLITQVEGNGTSQIAVDDIFRITGKAHGKVKHADLIYAWQSEIIDPLIKKFTCAWISKGSLRVKRETLPDDSRWASILNYGQGDCDFLATLTINSEVHSIQLPH
jgi:hypothetical protein